MTVHEPATTDEAVAIVSTAAAEGRRLWFAGSGTIAQPSSTSVVSSARMAKIIDWQPDDLTAVAEAGVRVGDLEATLAERSQTSLLPIADPDRTIGGLIAEGASSPARLKYGPTRDRVLEVTMVTGYSQVVRGGGRLVKNVTGYDLPRLVTGAHGSLGWISSVCLKLWPLPSVVSVVAIDDPSVALATLYRPVSVLESDTGSFAIVEGTAADVSAQIALVDGREVPDAPLMRQHQVRASVRVPPRFLSEAVSWVSDAGASQYIAEHGVGVVEAGWSDLTRADFMAVRVRAEELGGAAVLRRAGSTLDGIDRWGAPPPSIEIQRRLKTLFDPSGVCNSGILPGGV